jgi:hypothetical protein
VPFHVFHVVVLHWFATRLRSKGELLLFRDCNAMGEIQLRCLGMVFLSVKELKVRLVHRTITWRRTSLSSACDDAGLRPFGVAAIWDRMRNLMDERFDAERATLQIQFYTRHSSAF